MTATRKPKPASDERGVLTGHVAEKCAIILARENTFAREFASRAIDQPKLTPWMVVLPVLLIPYYLGRVAARRGAETCIDYYLRPRLWALDIATNLEDEADERPSEPLRVAETRQTKTLASHYRRLVAAKGEDYRALVLASYQTADAYREHVERVEEVQRALDEALLADADADVGAQAAAKMREAADRLMSVRREMHREEIAWLFG